MDTLTENLEARNTVEVGRDPRLERDYGFPNMTTKYGVAIKQDSGEYRLVHFRDNLKATPEDAEMQRRDLHDRLSPETMREMLNGDVSRVVEVPTHYNGSPSRLTFDLDGVRTREAEMRAARGLIRIEDLQAQFENAVEQRVEERFKNGLSYSRTHEEKRIGQAIAVLKEDCGVREVMLPRAPLGVVDPQSMTFEEVERVAVEATDREYASRVRSFNELKESWSELANTRHATLGRDLPDDYAHRLQSEITAMFEGDRDWVKVPTARDLFDAIDAASPIMADRLPPLQGLAAAIHDLGVERITDSHLYYLAHAAEDYLRSSLPEKLSPEQSQEVVSRLNAYSDGIIVPADDDLVGYYVSSGAAILDRAQALQERAHAFEGVPLLDFTATHDVAFGNELAREFGYDVDEHHHGHKHHHGLDAEEDVFEPELDGEGLG